MKEEGFLNIEANDTLFKLELYLHRITKANSTNSRQVEKICHLAAETCLRFCDRQQFAEQLCQRLRKAITEQKNYFILYLYDILLKNNRNVMKIAKKNIENLFLLVWDQVSIEGRSKSLTKFECLKAMARTWGLIYGEKVEETLRNQLVTRYHVNVSFDLQKKYEDLLNEIVERHRNRLQSASGQKRNKDEPEGEQKNNVGSQRSLPEKQKQALKGQQGKKGIKAALS